MKRSGLNAFGFLNISGSLRTESRHAKIIACFGIRCPLNSKSFVRPCGNETGAIFATRSVSCTTASVYGKLGRSASDGNRESPITSWISLRMRDCTSGKWSMWRMNHFIKVEVDSVPAPKRSPIHHNSWSSENHAYNYRYNIHFSHRTR